MGRKHPNKSNIPNKKDGLTPQGNEEDKFNLEDLKGWKLSGNYAHVMASVRYVQHDFQCFSDWSKQEIKAFWHFIKKLHKYDWETLIRNGGKSAKTGLAPTIIPMKKYPDTEFRRAIENYFDMIEFRVDDTKRVHGFRDGPIFYICWLDKNHQICA